MRMTTVGRPWWVQRTHSRQGGPWPMCRPERSVDEYSALAADIARRLLHDEDAAALIESWPEWHGARERQWCIERLHALQIRVRQRS